MVKAVQPRSRRRTQAASADRLQQLVKMGLGVAASAAVTADMDRDPDAFWCWYRAKVESLMAEKGMDYAALFARKRTS